MTAIIGDQQGADRKEPGIHEVACQAVAQWLIDRHHGGSTVIDAQKFGVDIIKHTPEGMRLDVVVQPLPDHFRTTFKVVGPLATTPKNEDADVTMYVMVARNLEDATVAVGLLRQKLEPFPKTTAVVGFLDSTGHFTDIREWLPTSAGTTPLPTGTVTFLFTDIEGSTGLWEHQRDSMNIALARHDAIMAEAIEAHGGKVFKTVGDAFCAAFSRPSEALNAAVAAQRAFFAEPWDAHCVIRARMALHTGVAEERNGDYFGPPVNAVARLLSAGYGGQTLLSEATQLMVRDRLPPNTELRDLGEHRLKDLIHPVRIFQVVADELPTDFPQLKTVDSGASVSPVQATTRLALSQEIQDDDFENPWVPKVLGAFAELQQATTRSRSLGVTFYHLLVHLQVESETEDYIGVQDAMSYLMAAQLVEQRGNYLHLSTQGWETAIGHVPGSEGDEDFLRASVAEWRDPNVRKPQPNWLSGRAICGRLKWAPDIYQMLDIGRRLRDQGLIELYDEMSQEIFVRPTYRALQRFPES